jgi:CubicO group peptidase (beta-lactamase class C family)
MKFGVFFAALTMVSAHVLAQSGNAPPAFLDAQASDPVTMGWMVGSPPPANRVIRFADGSYFRFPQTRWTFSNYRQLVPTRPVERGTMPAIALKSALRPELEAVRFKKLDSDETFSFGDMYAKTYADGIVVLHRGQVVYEKYSGALKPDGQHAVASLTKSFVGILGASMVADGTLDEKAPVSKYLPELKDGGFGDATIRQLLDMTTGLQYSENYADPNAQVWSHVRAGGVLPKPANYTGPQTFYEFLLTVQKEGEHGRAFAYKTVNSDVMAWVIARVTGKSMSEMFSERIWRKLGVEHDAYFTVDSIGTEFAGGGLNTNLRDMARFGEMMRNNGRVGSQQVVPQAVVADIAKGASPEQFAQAGYPWLKGWSYRNMWWISHNSHGAYMARGIHGQSLYIDPKAEMVIARFGSHPIASGNANDPFTLPAFAAMADALMKRP